MKTFLLLISFIATILLVGLYFYWNQPAPYLPANPPSISKTSSAEDPQAGIEVTVKFSGTGLTRGSIIAGIYNSEVDFNRTNPPLKRCTIDLGSSEEAVCQFSGLAPGHYVVSAFQDKNGNETLDKNMLGLPQEKYGFSNNARGRFGPPKYPDCQFEVSDSSVVEIKLR